MFLYTDFIRLGSEPKTPHPNLPRRSRVRCAVDDAFLLLMATLIPRNRYKKGTASL